MRDIPVISKIMRAIIVEDYASVIEIITDKDFDPNAKTKAWGSPMVSAIINILGDLDEVEDKDSLKNILKEIVKHKDFDPNAKDIEGETILMYIAKHKDFNFIAPFIFLNDKLNIDEKNKLGLDAITVAENNNNKVLSELIIAFKATKFKRNGLPKKRVGIKPICKVSEQTIAKNSEGNKKVLEKIEFAFTDEQKNNPVSLYWLIKQFLKGNYSECHKIVKDVHFNPNEVDRWEEPVLSSLIYYSQDSMVSYDEQELKSIATEIIENRHFDYNYIDEDCNTPIMVSMGFKRLNWLTDMLYSASCTRTDVRNDMGETLKDIAHNAHNDEFYSTMLKSSYVH